MWSLGLKALEDGAWTTRISENQQKGFARWQGDAAARRAVSNNRVRLKSRVGRAALKRRSEKVERSFAHILDGGVLRRTWLRGDTNVEKRYTIQAAACNLGLVIRHRFSAGTPRQAAAAVYFSYSVHSIGANTYFGFSPPSGAMVMCLIIHTI